MNLPHPEVILLDNGSLEPASVLSLRHLANGLEQRIGRRVHPVSLLHSSKIPAAQLGGEPATTLGPFLRQRGRVFQGEYQILPLFIGPSGAIVEYLPQKIQELKLSMPELAVQVGECLFQPEDERLTDILESHLERLLAQLEKPEEAKVLLVDHGSPRREVTAVRDALAASLRERLGSRVKALLAASMERRPEPEFAFNEPLLEKAFALDDFSSGEVLVSLLFLSPGRHAGPGGDIAQICAQAESRHPGLKTRMSALLGEHPLLLDILASRAEGKMTRFA